MRLSRAARLSCAATVMAVVPPAAGAMPWTFWEPVPISPAAIADDPVLATMRCVDLIVASDGRWESASLRVELSTGAFYDNIVGGYFRPHPAWLSTFPALEYDTYVTAPGDTGFGSGAPALLGGHAGAPIWDFGESSGTFSVHWQDLTLDAPGVYPIARLTFPLLSNFPAVHSTSFASQVDPNSTENITGFGGPFSNRWVPDAGGAWHDPGNWFTGRVPSGNVFAEIDVGGDTVYTIEHSEGDTWIHHLRSEEHFVLSGGTFRAQNPLTLNNGMTLNGGTLRIGINGSPLAIGPLGGRLEEMVSLGDGMTMSGGGAPLVVAGQLDLHGVSTLSTGATLQFDGSRTIGGSGTVLVNGSARFDVGDGNVLTFTHNSTISKSGPGTLRIDGSYAQVPTSTIDVAEGALVNDYTGSSPLSAVRDAIINGYNGGSWDGSGINSSTASADERFAIAYAEASELFTAFPATFAGEEIDDTTLLVLLTPSGDANLDQLVDLQDFNRLAGNFGRSGRDWSDGDFTYDGIVNLDDFNRLAANFGLRASGPEVTPQDWANLAAAVPEQGVGGLVAGCAVFLRRRRPAGRHA